jgi:hypothetical protein
MIDGIKFRLDPDTVRNNNVLKFCRLNGNNEIAEYWGLKIKLHPDSCYVSGSIHKYWNDGKHNANDFRLSEFRKALNDLSETFRLNPALWHLLGNELLNVYDSLLVVDSDSIDIQSLDKDELKIYSDGIRPGYWIRNWKYREDKKRALKRFRDIIGKHSQSKIKSDVRALIEAKINSLIDVEFNETRKDYVTDSPLEKLETEKNSTKNIQYGTPQDRVKTCYDFTKIELAATLIYYCYRLSYVFKC